MRRLSPDEHERALAAAERVFGPEDRRWEAPFTSHLPVRLLLGDTDRDLDDAQLAAVAQAARADGDTIGYAAIWPPSRNSDDIDRVDLTAPVPSLDGQLFTEAGLEFALWSPRGRWAVIVEEDDCAIVGGDERFVRTVCDLLGLDEQAALETWLEDRDEERALGHAQSWVPGLLDHLVGRERADGLLAGRREAFEASARPPEPETWRGRLATWRLNRWFDRLPPAG